MQALETTLPEACRHLARRRRNAASGKARFGHAKNIRSHRRGRGGRRAKVLRGWAAHFRCPLWAKQPDYFGLRKFAGRHELIQLFSQAVAYSLGRGELKEQVKRFEKLCRNNDGFLTAADIEVDLLGGPA